MPKKVELKTSKSTLSVGAYIDAIENPTMRKDARRLLKLFKEITATKPRMWGASIVGFGEYTYFRANGAQGEYLATGFSIRKSGPTIYIMPGYQNYASKMARLGPHKLGKSCLYLKNLEVIDMEVLADIIRAGIRDLKKTHAVRIG